MKFLLELSIENRIAVPTEECRDYEVYSGYFGKRIRVLKHLDRKLVRRIENLGINALEFLPPWVDRDIDLSLLAELKGLHSLIIHAAVPINWSPVNELTQLKVLKMRTSGFAPERVDLTRFRSLHTCLVTWHQEWASVLQAESLKHLTIEQAQGIESLELSALSKLREVSVVECKGLEVLGFADEQPIESLAVTGTRSFRGVRPQSLLKQLKYVAVSGHTQFEIQSLQNCRNLKKLWLNRVGKLPSLDFLKNCHDLAYLQMLYSTNIEDGDLGILTQLPKLKVARFENRRHYSHTVTEVNQRLAGRS